MSRKYFVMGRQSSEIRDSSSNEYTWIDTSGHDPIDLRPIVACQERGDTPEIYITDDYFPEVRSWLEAEPRLDLGRCHVHEVYSEATKWYLSYREQYAQEPLRDIIVFRSGPHPSAYVPGMDFSDNARALFAYMLAAQYNDRYELVWFVHDPQEFAGRYAGVPNVTFLPDSGADSEEKTVRDAYYEKLCLAKWIFFTDAYGFCRYPHPGQVRVQLWHGCGFKTRVNFVPCEHRYEYNIVISPLYKEIHQRIYGLRPDQVLVTGYPKEDWLLHPVEEWQQRLGVPQADRYIFWLPTFRKVEQKGLAEVDAYMLQGDTGLPLATTQAQLEALNDVLSAQNTMLLIKLHPFQDRSLVHVEHLSHVFLLDNAALHQADLPINQVLADAAALISDYSSAAVDYMILDRPIAFALTDLEQYTAKRGFVFDDILNWLPGEKLYTFEDMLSFIRDIGQGVDRTAELRSRLNAKMHTFFDDQSSKRVCEALGIE